jgi:hypothetical protein
MEVTGSPGTKNETSNYSKLLKIRNRRNSTSNSLTYDELLDRRYTAAGVHLHVYTTTPNPQAGSKSFLPNGYRGLCS